MKRKRDLPREARVVVAVRLHPIVAARLKLRAAARGEKLSDLLRNVLEKASRVAA